MRQEFPVKVRKAAWDRAGGICECGCSQPFTNADPVEYDHIVEAALGGEATIGNCIALRKSCHRAKTSERAPVIAKASRIERKTQGLTGRKAVIPGSKTSGWKRKLDGTVVRR